MSYGHFSDIWFGLACLVLYDMVCGYCLDILPCKINSFYLANWLSYGHYSDIWFGLVLYGLVWFCMVWCVGIVKTNFWWKFEVSMLKNDWVMVIIVIFGLVWFGFVWFGVWVLSKQIFGENLKSLCWKMTQLWSL